MNASTKFVQVIEPQTGICVIDLRSLIRYRDLLFKMVRCGFAAAWENSILCPGTYLLVVSVSNHVETVAYWPNAVVCMVAPISDVGTGKMPESDYQGYVWAIAKWNIEADMLTNLNGAKE